MESAKLSFFGGISRPPLFPAVKYQHLKLLSIPDILAMKVHAMLNRNVFRDYFDVATVLQFENVTLGELIQWFYKKYGEEAKQFSASIVLKSLTWLHDVTPEKQDVTKHQDFWNGDQKKKTEEILSKKAKTYLVKG